MRNVSIHPQNESPIIESGFLQPLINLLSFKDNEEVQCHAISTLRNLAASSEKNKTAIVKAGAVQSIKELVLEVPINVQSEMTACVAVLALSGKRALPIPCKDYLRLQQTSSRANYWRWEFVRC